METDFFLFILVCILFSLNQQNKSSTISTFSNKVSCPIIKVDKCFVLTLGEQTERFKKFKSTYKLPIPLEVIIGIDTKIPENAEKYKSLVTPEKYNDMYNFDKGIKPRPNHTYFNSGALGCYLGHMDFYDRSFKENLNYSIIFEDNVLLQPSFNSDLNNALTRIPEDFDICFFHAYRYVSDKVIRCDKNIDLLKWVNGTKCYLINVKSMKKYYSLFYPIDNHVDRIYEKLIFNGVKVYLLYLNSIKTDKSKSLVGHAGGMIDGEKEFFYFNNLTKDQIMKTSDFKPFSSK